MTSFVFLVLYYLHVENTFWMSKKFVVGMIALVILASVFIVSIEIAKSNQVHRAKMAAASVTPSPVVSPIVEPPVTLPTPEPVATVHVPLPVEVRGIYWTALTAATKHADTLIAYMQQTGLNTVVMDVKVDGGQLAFAPHDTSLTAYAEHKPVLRDLDGLLKKLADDHFYRIARIQVMKDNTFTSLHPGSAMKDASGNLWHDKTGAAWIDPASPDVAAYSVALAREVYARGFDEVQFDYVRFASDGSVSSIVYPFYNGTDAKVDVMKKFYDAVGTPLKKDGIPVSFDLFGLTCMTNNGLGIGQRLDTVAPNADFISPMVYPSHYANGFQGFANPANHPYDVIKISLDHAIGLLLPPKIETSSVKNADGKEILSTKTIPPTQEEKAAAQKQFRPWIQDFEIGAVYTAPMIEAEIKAVRDAGSSGFLIWNARNVYEPANYLK